MPTAATAILPIAMGPTLFDSSSEEYRKILRKMELETYGAVVSTLRAQGELSKDRRKLLEDLSALMKISPERHKAEIRRAVNDEKLSEIADRVTGGADTEWAWALEGRRIVPLMPRLIHPTPFTAFASTVSKAIAQNPRICLKQTPIEDRTPSYVRDPDDEDTLSPVMVPIASPDSSCHSNNNFELDLSDAPLQQKNLTFNLKSELEKKNEPMSKKIPTGPAPMKRPRSPTSNQVVNFSAPSSKVRAVSPNCVRPQPKIVTSPQPVVPQPTKSLPPTQPRGTPSQPVGSQMSKSLPLTQPKGTPSQPHVPPTSRATTNIVAQAPRGPPPQPTPPQPPKGTQSQPILPQPSKGTPPQPTAPLQPSKLPPLLQPIASQPSKGTPLQPVTSQPSKGAPLQPIPPPPSSKGTSIPPQASKGGPPQLVFPNRGAPMMQHVSGPPMQQILPQAAARGPSSPQVLPQTPRGPPPPVAIRPALFQSPAGSIPGRVRVRTPIGTPNIQRPALRIATPQTAHVQSSQSKPVVNPAAKQFFQVRAAAPSAQQPQLIQPKEVGSVPPRSQPVTVNTTTTTSATLTKPLPGKANLIVVHKNSLQTISVPKESVSNKPTNLLPKSMSTQIGTKSFPGCVRIISVPSGTNIGNIGNIAGSGISSSSAAGSILSATKPLTSTAAGQTAQKNVYVLELNNDNMGKSILLSDIISSGFEVNGGGIQKMNPQTMNLKVVKEEKPEARSQILSLAEAAVIDNAKKTSDNEAFLRSCGFEFPDNNFLVEENNGPTHVVVETIPNIQDPPSLDDIKMEQVIDSIYDPLIEESSTEVVTEPSPIDIFSTAIASADINLDTNNFHDDGGSRLVLTDIYDSQSANL